MKLHVQRTNSYFSAVSLYLLVLKCMLVLKIFLCNIHHRLKWSEVFEPAIKLAKEGFKVTAHTGQFSLEMFMSSRCLIQNRKKRLFLIVFHSSFLVFYFWHIKNFLFWFSNILLLQILWFFELELYRLSHKNLSNQQLGSLESTQEARIAWGIASSNSDAFFMPSKLPACFISRWSHADIWTNC